VLKLDVEGERKTRITHDKTGSFDSVLVIARVLSCSLSRRKKVERPVKSGSICVESMSCRKQPESISASGCVCVGAYTQRRRDVPNAFSVHVHDVLALEEFLLQHKGHIDSIFPGHLWIGIYYTVHTSCTSASASERMNRQEASSERGCPLHS
jgi:hypothetical protein